MRPLLNSFCVHWLTVDTDPTICVQYHYHSKKSLILMVRETVVIVHHSINVEPVRPNSGHFNKIFKKPLAMTRLPRLRAALFRSQTRDFWLTACGLRLNAYTETELSHSIKNKQKMAPDARVLHFWRDGLLEKNHSSLPVTSEIIGVVDKGRNWRWKKAV